MGIQSCVIYSGYHYKIVLLDDYDISVSLIQNLLANKVMPMGQEYI